jgi:predicted metal-dependent peptidase
MTDEGRRTLIGFIETVSREFPEVRVYLVTHTSRVEWEGWLRAGGDISKAKEATRFEGGTDFRPAYDAVSKVARFDVAVHFTDGFNAGPWPEPCARQLIVGLWGSGSGATPVPEGVRVVPVASVEGDL